jgi:hypothetical protein
MHCAEGFEFVGAVRGAEQGTLPVASVYTSLRMASLGMLSAKSYRHSHYQSRLPPGSHRIDLTQLSIMPRLVQNSHAVHLKQRARPPRQ